MASLNLLTILIITSLLLLITPLSIQQDDEVYILDNPTSDFHTRSRFLTSVVKKGSHCTPSRNICNGVKANKGTGLLYCCKNHCRNILSDKNNCGRCGSKCRFGQLCCNGVCTSVGFSRNHCGKCNKRCPNGVPCEYGSCGYA